MRKLPIVGTLFVAALAVYGVAQAVKDAGLGSHLASQAAADAIKDFANAEGAFIAAGNVNPDFDRANLSSLIQFPTDPIVVVKLKGSEIRAAFEKSVALYPQSNRSFLQISGFTAEFSPTANADSRVLNVTAGNGSLDENKTYEIAMPLSLGRGGMGYFTIWDKAKIVRTLSATMESVLKGKKYSETTPRWQQRP